MRLSIEPLKVLLCLLVFLFASVLNTLSAPNEDLVQFPQCRHCQMLRSQYAQSRMVVGYNDGSEFGFCSIHCLAIDLVLNTDKTPSFVKTGDYATRLLIDAETASWVLGGRRKGVMTQRAKWAFRSVKDAELFIKENGGKLISFEQALEAAYHDMYTDSKVIRNKRKLKMMIKDFEKRALLEHDAHPCAPDNPHSHK
ncbi:MAG: nitrous oxide reductase accessory protein NosL [Syntrophobacteraceae bacterium]